MLRSLIHCFLALAAFLTLVPAAPAHATTAEGRALLFNSGDPTMAGLYSAHTQFQAAVAANANDPEANLFLAATRILVLINNSASYTPGPPIENLRELLDGLGISAAGRDYFDWTAQSAKDASGDYTPLPINAPSGPDFQHVITTVIIPEINAALANLSKVGSGFATILTAAETGSSRDTEVDYGDVLLFRAGLHGIKTLLQILSAYDLYADTHILSRTGITTEVIHLNKDLIDIYPQLLKLLTNGAETLGHAKESFLSAVSAYVQASEAIRVEGDLQDNDLFTIEEADKAEEAHFRGQLVEAKTALEAQRTATFQNRSATTTRRVDLNRFLGTATITPPHLRNLAPYFDRDGNIIAGTFPDTTMGQIFPDCTTELLLEAFLDISAIVFQLRSAAIAVDGLESDWAGIPPMAAGYFNTVIPFNPGRVFQYAKVVKDDQYLYWMLRYSPSIVTPTTINFTLSDDMQDGPVRSISASIDTAGSPPHWLSNCYMGLCNHFSPGYSDYAIGQVIEGRVPLWFIEQNGKLDGALGISSHIPDGAYIKDSFILTTENVPRVDAGPALMATDSVTLSGRSVFSGLIISNWQWSLKHRTNPAHNRSATGANPTLTLLANGIYDVTLTATDASGRTFTDTTILSASGTPGTYSQTDLDQAVTSERAKWDVGVDNIFGLPEAIRALQTVSGLR